ncbi:Alpha/Beta hydrolase protein [Aspergillus cavernicola]|uniref:Alpha/Beta hydrolase protein n=1 Tax=Aspergillus cavernicola TaxID=176166 RepID=A0ABR4IAV7_9EURO
MSEGCLTLRIDRPAYTPASAKLPGMVWIYGSGDSFGQIYGSAYHPTTLVTGAVQKGFPVIYVAMNYRVGIFGFAAPPASDSLDAGLLDQRLALRQSHGRPRDSKQYVGNAYGTTYHDRTMYRL